MTTEWFDIAEEDWNRRTVSEREYWLRLNNLPSSEAGCDFKLLRPQIKSDFIVDVIEADCKTGSEPYQMDYEEAI